MNKRNASAVSSIAVLLLVAGSLVVLNVIGYGFNLGRLDVTHNAAYTLSDGSKRVVSDLSEDMTIRAFFSSDLPAQFADTERQVRDLLLEYEAASGGKINLRFFDPSGDEDIAEKAEEYNVRRVQHQALDRDRVSVVEGYRGLDIEYLGEHETLPVIQDSTGLEYDITMAIQKLRIAANQLEKRKIGVLSGHEGPTLAEGLTGLRDALPLYELVEVDASSEIDPEISAVLVVSPETALSDAELRHLDQFVMRGGSLGVFGGGLKLSLEGEPSAEMVDSGLNGLLGPYGVEVQQDVVLDGQCSRAPMRGPMGLQVAVPFPPVPVVSFDDEAQDHSVLFRIQNATLPFTNSLSLTSAPEGVEVKVLARSSGNSWRETGSNVNLRPRRPQEWSMGGDSGPFPLMVAIEGPLRSAFAGVSSEGPQVEAPERAEGPVRVLVVGTSFFMNDQFLPPPGADGSRGPEGPFKLALNAVDWLATETALLAIRAKDSQPPPIENVAGDEEQLQAAQEAQEQVLEAAQEGDQEAAEAAIEQHEDLLQEWEDAKASRALKHKLWNTFGLPFLLIIFGLIRWNLRKSKRANMRL